MQAYPHGLPQAAPPPKKFPVWAIVLIVVLLLAVLVATRGIRTVPQGEVWTVERFGAFTGMLNPGLNFIVPFIDTIGRRMNVSTNIAR